MTGDRVSRRVGPGSRPPRRADEPQHGMVTVETALAVPMLVLVGLLAAMAPGAVGAHVACLDAAREAALLLARGWPAADAVDTAARVAPPGAQVVVAPRGTGVMVTVSAEAALAPAPLASVLSLPVQGTAVARYEPGVGPP
jgi:hypothetical protein